MRQPGDFQPYVRAIFDRLGLRDWQVVVRDDPPDSSTAYAHIECTYGRKRADVEFSWNFLRGSEEDQRHAVVHESLHCHWAAADFTVRELAGDDRYDLYRLPMEYAVDGIAVAIAPLMPLPSEILSPIRQEELPN